MQRVTEPAGIEVQIPTALVNFFRYEPPFAHFEASEASGVRVLLISQLGDQAILFWLYDIMQTLEIVPVDGPRGRANDRFNLEGRNAGSFRIPKPRY